MNAQESCFCVQLVLYCACARPQCVKAEEDIRGLFVYSYSMILQSEGEWLRDEDFRVEV